MQSMTVSNLRANLAATLDMVIADKEEIIITREDGDAVLLDLSEYESLKETAYLLKSPENAKRIFRSIEQLERGEGQTREFA